MEAIGKIRRWHRNETLSISQIAQRRGASRNTIKKYLKSKITAPKYAARPKRFPVMGRRVTRLLELLREDAAICAKSWRQNAEMVERYAELSADHLAPYAERSCRLPTVVAGPACASGARKSASVVDAGERWSTAAH